MNIKHSSRTHTVNGSRPEKVEVTRSVTQGTVLASMLIFYYDRGYRVGHQKLHSLLFCRQCKYSEISKKFRGSEI